MAEIILIYKDLSYNIGTKSFSNGASNIEVLRYLKGINTNKARFKSRFVDVIKKVYKEYPEFNCAYMLKEMMDNYDKVTPFSYAEAFKIESQEFKALVFGSINITDMITELGHTRIATDGIKVKHKQFDANGNFTGYNEYDNIYEVHEVDGTKLGINEKLYVLKCWCTTTNKEHWLWINDEHKNKPLEAVASTFMVHENVLPHIKEIKRQGDVLLVEMNEEVEPEGEMISLTADQYFGLLTCQS